MTHATPGPVSGDDAAARPLVQLSGVQKHFGDLHVLKDIDLEVAAGEVVVVLGPSGSGKSTLCRTINRLETIDEGEIRIEGTVLPTSGKGLAALRSDDSGITTADGLELTAGPIITTLAVEQALTGEPGAFGFADSAQAVIPGAEG